ncbi:hypothetical protein GGX14DRAFT_577263 [Mycena pura]|uniref:DUF6532 domain-containing protein n=1 Tax=Mycena pura TaxID=153505 RepID=A0AAD6Y6F1_9AGAR|nr:hypothetical protein GGX14DRAFT_577263 [Mycena pura]
MAWTKTTARLLDSSDSSDDDTVPKRAPSKADPMPKALQSHDAAAENATAVRPIRARQPTGKQDKNDKENLAAAQLRLEKAKKAVEKAQRQTAQTNKAPKPTTDGDNGFESEEKDDTDADETVVVFSSSIRALNALPAEAPRPSTLTRKPPKNPRAAVSRTPATPPPSSPSRPEFYAPLDDEMRTPSLSGEQHENSRVDDDSRGRSLHSTSRKRPNEQPASSPPPEKRTCKEPRREPLFAETYVAVAGARPKAADYEPVVRALLLTAMVEFCMLILTLNAFPDISTQVDWAKRCFKNACKTENVRFSMTERIIKLITKRASWIRGQIITQCRALFTAHYKFNRASSSAKTITANRDLSESLKTDACYHYKDTVNATGYGENKILLDIRKAAVFKDDDSVGAIFASHFKLYPFVLLALEFAALQLCNSEWSTGKHQQSTFSEKQVGKDYLAHHADLENWAKMNPEVVDKLRRKWYIRASSHLTGSGATTSIPTYITPTQADALRAELAGRTGDTDSEAEDGQD